MCINTVNIKIIKMSDQSISSMETGGGGGRREGMRRRGERGWGRRGGRGRGRLWGRVGGRGWGMRGGSGGGRRGGGKGGWTKMGERGGKTNYLKYIWIIYKNRFNFVNIIYSAHHN